MARMLPLVFLASLVGLTLPTHASEPGQGDLRVGPLLQAAHSSGQGWLPQITGAAIADGVTDLRDGIYWSRVEREGAYIFDQPTTTYPDALARAGAGMTMTINAGHPAYDDGHTPHSAAAVSALAAYAAAAVQRFPAIHTVEVGNEVNAANFVSGPVLEAGLEARARYHLAQVRAIHAAVKAVRPEVRILGGSAHSISGRYLGDVFAQGGAEVMDALALHPYTTPVEHMVREIAYLRSLPGAGGIDIEITEFGHDGAPRDAADHLLKSYCAYALADVHRVAWYPLHPRGDGFAPLYTAQGMRSVVGDGYHMIRSELEGAPVRDAAPDPFTFACAFGPAAAPTHLVIWGAPRGLTLAPGLIARDATGAASEATALSPEAPLLISADDGGAVVLGENVTLAPQTRLADSYLQYALPKGESASAPGDPFARFVRTGQDEVPLVTRPGQDGGAVPWRPYRALAESNLPRLSEAFLMPSRGPRGAMDVVHRYTATAAIDATLDLRLAPWDGSEDGVTVHVRAGQADVFDGVITQPFQLEAPLSLATGDVLEVSVGPGNTATGDFVEYRIILEVR